MNIYKRTTENGEVLESENFIHFDDGKTSGVTTFFSFVKGGDYAKAEQELIANMKEKKEVELPPEAPKSEEIYKSNIRL